MATHQLNYATHQLENLQLPSEENALNFQYWDVFSSKPSPEAWTTIFSLRASDPDLQKANLKCRWSLEHLSPASAGLSVLELSPVGSSGSVHGRGCCKKRHRNIESLKRFLRKVTAFFQLMCCVIQLMSGHKDLRRPRWSSGYHTRLWIRGSRVTSRPGCKNPECDFLRKESKAVGPVS